MPRRRPGRRRSWHRPSSEPGCARRTPLRWTPCTPSGRAAGTSRSSPRWRPGSRSCWCSTRSPRSGSSAASACSPGSGSCSCCAASRARCGPRSRSWSPSPPASSTRRRRCSASTPTACTTSRRSCRPGTGWSTWRRWRSAARRCSRRFRRPVVYGHAAGRRAVGCLGPAAGRPQRRVRGDHVPVPGRLPAGGRAPTVYAGAFVITTYLELIGTRVGDLDVVAARPDRPLRRRQPAERDPRRLLLLRRRRAGRGTRAAAAGRRGCAGRASRRPRRPRCLPGSAAAVSRHRTSPRWSTRRSPTTWPRAPARRCSPRSSCPRTSGRGSRSSRWTTAPPRATRGCAR